MRSAKFLPVLLTFAIMMIAWATESRNPENKATVGISGRITGLAGNDHVVIKVSNTRTYRTTTRTSGMWSIANIDEGVYVITPIHARYNFEPENTTVQIAAHPVGDLNFIATSVEIR